MEAGASEKTFRNIALLAIIFACLCFYALTFHSRVRFAHPISEEFARWAKDYHCYYGQIYGKSEPSDILYFGSSRTMFAIDPGLIEDAYGTITGDDKKAFVFSTAWTNPELQYFFFRDYLQHNPAPEVAFFELTTAWPMGEPVKYVHPLYPYLAPPDLYFDELRSWDLVNSRLFGLSDFLRLHLRHIDLNLTNLLVADRKFLVPVGDNCGSNTFTQELAAQRGLDAEFPQAASFDDLMRVEAESLLPPGGWEKAGDYDSLIEHYSENKAASRRLKLLGREWSLKKPAGLWYLGPLKDRTLHYYRRILKLGQAHDTRVVFYYMPTLYTPEWGPERMAFMENKLGSPVQIMPFEYALVTYHHYRDMVHLQPQARRFVSAWAASLIDPEEPD